MTSSSLFVSQTLLGTPSTSEAGRMTYDIGPPITADLMDVAMPGVFDPSAHPERIRFKSPQCEQHQR